MSRGADRAAALVVRAWQQDGALRVRVVEVGREHGGERTRCTTTSAAEAVATVAAWLQEVAAAAPEPPPAGPPVTQP